MDQRKALLVSLIIGAAGAALTFVYMKRFESKVTGGEMISVVIATEDVPIGGVINRNMLGIRDLPQAYTEARHVRAREIDQIIGARVTAGVHANESLLWTDLSGASDERRGLSALVQSGMRAVTVKTSLGSNFAGLLRPGDRVDLLFQGIDRGSLIPLLQNMLVLAIGSDMGGKRGKNTTFGNASTVTLSATLEQAQVLAFAQLNGLISLTLRNPDDITVIDKPPTTTAADLNDSEKRASLQKRVAPSQPKIERVQ